MQKEYTIADFLNIKLSLSPGITFDSAKVIYMSNLPGVFQIYEVPKEGGDPVQLTKYDDGVAGFALSRVDNRMIFLKDIDGNENDQIFIMDLDTKKTDQLTNNSKIKYTFGGWSYDGKKIAFSSNERNGKDFDIYLMDLETRETKRIFAPNAWSESYGFSKDDKYLIAVVANSNVDDNLYLIDLQNLEKEAKLLTPHEGNTLHGIPRWVSDSTGFYILSNENKNFIGLSFYNLAKNLYEDILDFDWDIESVSLSRDDEMLTITVNEGGYAKVHVYDRKTMNEIKDLDWPKGIIDNLYWSQDSKYLAYDFDSATRNSNIYIWDREKNKSTQLTNSPCGVSLDILVEPELISYKSFDGLEIPAFIYKSKEIKEKLPVIVNIHGGPEAQYRPYFASLTQYFVYHNYIVVAPNVRGSNGYGKEYLELDNIDKRLDSVADLKSLYDYLKTREDVDINKVVLMGGSYGGYMTLAGLAFYPDLWAAGVDIVGISNLVTFLENTSEYRRALRESEYGYLDKDREFLEKASPINKVDDMKAPLFIIHGKNDPRVPLSEAEQMYKVLNDKGQKVKLLVYEDEGHGLSKLKNRMDAYPQVIKFLDEVLKDK